MLTVSVNNATFNAPVGLYPQEWHTYNTIEVDAFVSVDAEIESLPLIDYTQIFTVIKEVMNQKHETLETIVSAVYCGLKALVSNVRIEVKVRKLHPPLNGKVDFTEVSFAD